MTYPKVTEIKRHEWEPEQIAASEDEVSRHHRTKIAKDTLKMPAPIAAVMGGPTHSEAKAYLTQQQRIDQWRAQSIQYPQHPTVCPKR